MNLHTITKPIGTPAPELGVRTRLLMAAGELFYREGIHAVGIQRLLDEADVARASFYAHFTSKDALVCAYLEHQALAWQSLVEERVLTPPMADVDRLLALFDVLGDWVASGRFRGCPFANAARELRGRDGPANRIVVQQRACQRALIERLVRALDLPSGAILADALIALLDGAAVRAAVDGVPDSAQRARRAAQALLSAHGA